MHCDKYSLIRIWLMKIIQQECIFSRIYQEKGEIFSGIFLYERNSKPKTLIHSNDNSFQLEEFRGRSHWPVGSRLVKWSVKMLSRQMKEPHIKRAWNFVSVRLCVLCHLWSYFSFFVVAKRLARVLKAKENTLTTSTKIIIYQLQNPISSSDDHFFSLSSSSSTFSSLLWNFVFLFFLFLPFLAIARFVYYLEFNCGVGCGSKT